MKYDFTTVLDRKGKDAIAIDAVGAPGSSYPAPREQSTPRAEATPPRTPFS